MKPRYIRLLGDIDPRLQGVTFAVLAWDADWFAVLYFGQAQCYRYTEQGATWELAEEP